MTIDTLAYVKALEAAGVERHAAEAQVEALTRHILPDIATKSDLQTELAAVRSDISKLETRVTMLTWAVGANLALTVAILGVLLRASGHG